MSVRFPVGNPMLVRVGPLVITDQMTFDESPGTGLTVTCTLAAERDLDADAIDVTLSQEMLENGTSAEYAVEFPEVDLTAALWPDYKSKRIYAHIVGESGGVVVYRKVISILVSPPWEEAA